MGVSRGSELLSEALGTYFLTLTIGLNVLQHTALAPVSIGSMLMVMIFATGGISGGHFNPAVTLGVFCCDRRFSGAKMIFFWFAQCAAAFLAALTYWAILGTTFGMHPQGHYHWHEAFFAELMFTMALVLVVLNVALSHDKDNQYFALAIGFTVMAAAFAIGPISGCCLNPAVAVGVIMAHKMSAGVGLSWLVMYTGAPLLGGLMAWPLFTIVRAQENNKKEWMNV